LQRGEGVSARILSSRRPLPRSGGAPRPPCAPIAAWEIDRKTRTARRILTDGAREPALPLRELFEQYFDETVGKHGKDGAMVDVKTRRCA
jgi:hypothetical protein